MLKNQVMEFLNANNLISKRQSGYRPLHSTTTALLKITNDIKRALSRNTTAVLLLLDFTKAFDSVEYGLLCDKLRTKFFFHSSAVSMIMDYLCG